jgi:hypothetical protein
VDRYWPQEQLHRDIRELHRRELAVQGGAGPSAEHVRNTLGTGLFDLFHRGLGIATKLGPGTADNASNNVTAADRLRELLRSELDIHLSAKDMIGCVCHIANLAALKYLEGEGESTATVRSSLQFLIVLTATVDSDRFFRYARLCVP